VAGFSAEGTLSRILVAKRRELEEAKALLPLADVKAQVHDAPPARDFCAALRGNAAPTGQPGSRRLAVIAEFKRRSPSGGEIRAHANAVEVAQQYMLAGAQALSVLTDVEFFGGSLVDLVAVRAGTRLPVLRKDFIIDPYMIWRARAAGADAVLLIVAALEDPDLLELADLARDLGMTALVEVHSEGELERALAAKPAAIGFNHRDLRTLEMDLSLSEKLKKLVPPGIVTVAESGLRTSADLRRMRDVGVDAVLIGETLLRAPDPGAALRQLVAGV
jgi:indole-3-glycerol phosphate synthase